MNLTVAVWNCFPNLNNNDFKTLFSELYFTLEVGMNDLESNQHNSIPSIIFLLWKSKPSPEKIIRKRCDQKTLCSVEY